MADTSSNAASAIHTANESAEQRGKVTHADAETANLIAFSVHLSQTNQSTLARRIDRVIGKRLGYPLPRGDDDPEEEPEAVTVYNGGPTQVGVEASDLLAAVLAITGPVILNYETLHRRLDSERAGFVVWNMPERSQYRLESTVKP